MKEPSVDKEGQNLLRLILRLLQYEARWWRRPNPALPLRVARDDERLLASEPLEIHREPEYSREFALLQLQGWKRHELAAGVLVVVAAAVARQKPVFEEATPLGVEINQEIPAALDQKCLSTLELQLGVILPGHRFLDVDCV